MHAFNMVFCLVLVSSPIFRFEPKYQISRALGLLFWVSSQIASHGVPLNA